MILALGLFFAICFLVIFPLFFMSMSYFFSDETFSYKKGLFLSGKLVIIAIFFQAIQLAAFVYLPSLAPIVTSLLSIALIVIIVYIIKKSIETTVLKAILIQALNIALSLLVTFSFRYYVCQAYKIPAVSNMPTLLAGDHILVNKFIYRLSLPEKNDVVIFKYPQNERIDYVKRIVALPGEEIRIIDKKPHVNGKPVEENFAIFTDEKVVTEGNLALRDNMGPVTVPPDSYFVLGDNRDNSFDSRFWGFVRREQIKGKADVVYFSMDNESKTFRIERIGRKIR